MSTAKFTPGPWSITDSVRDPFYVTSNRGIVCQVVAGYAENTEGAAANARLIKMTPTMLEALVSAAGALQGAADCMRKIDAPKTAARLEEIALASLLVIKEATGGGS